MLVNIKVALMIVLSWTALDISSRNQLKASFTDYFFD